MHPATTYYVLRALNGIGMSLTFTSYSPYVLQDLHVTLAEVELLNALFFFTIFACELPTGMLADGRGRAWSVRMAFIFHGIGMLAYACAVGFWSALLAEMIEAVAFAFMSGACNAWVTDALIRRNEEHRIRTIFTTEAILTAVVLLMSSQIGHALSLWSFRAPWAFGSVVQVFGLIAAIRWMNGDGEPLVRITEREAFRRAWVQIRVLPGLRWGAVAGMLFGFVIPMNHFWSPYFRTYIHESYIGLVWILIYAAMAASAWMAKNVLARTSQMERVIPSMLFFAGCSLVMMGIAGTLAGALTYAVIHNVTRGLFLPQLETFLQRQFESSYRATAGSVISFIRQCGSGGILVGVWFFARGMDTSRASIGTVWVWCGSLLAGSALVLFLFRPQTSSVK